MMYYTVKNGRKRPFYKLSVDELQHLLNGLISMKYSNSNWINIINRELKMRDRFMKINKLKENMNLIV